MEVRERVKLTERDGSIDVSVVVPAKDEERTIGGCLDKINSVFARENIDGEIIVSDSSEDRTPEIAREKGARVIRPEEEGYGNAYIEGMVEARGEYVVMGDADNTYDFSDLPKILEPLRENDADMVIGNRLDGGVKEGAMSIPHRIGQPIMTGLLNMFHRTGVSDAHSGFRGFDREALEKMNLQAGGMDFASELIIEANRKDLEVEEVDIELHPRPEDSEATYDYFNDSWDHLRLILLRAPTQAFAVPGMVLIAIGIFLLGTTSLDLLFSGFYPSILASLLIFAGVNLFGSGVFARHLAVSRNLVDHDRLSEFFSDNFTPGRGFWMGVFMFGIGLLPILPVGIEGLSIQLHVLLYTALCLGIEIGFLSVMWDFVRG